MRRLIVALAVLALVLASAGTASAKHTRTVSDSYQKTGPSTAIVARCNTQFLEGSFIPARQPPVILLRPAWGERSVSLRITDAVPGQSIIAFVVQPPRREYKVICGATSKPIPVIPFLPVALVLLDGASDRGPSVVTRGVVRATFYR